MMNEISFAPWLQPGEKGLMEFSALAINPIGKERELMAEAFCNLHISSPS